MRLPTLHTPAFRRLTFAVIVAATPTLLLADQSRQARPTEAVDLAMARPGRDPKQPIDEEYTRKIKEYTTETFFLSPLVDYMPAAKGVPTPTATLGDIAGAPGKLPYSKETHDYMRLLAKSTPRARVFTIGQSEEGREMIAVAVASEALLARLDANKADLAKLADPRTIQLNDAVADEIARRAAPIYYITGAIHSTEAGAPTALMELAYRLAVDESPYIRNIREHVITLITPVVEVDGRDRVVDLYNYRKKNPDKTVPGALYWGKYVAHDNNRDAMGVTLKLTEHVLNTFVDWKAQVLHDLHESGLVPLRQHDWRRPVQRLARSDPDQRVADDRLEQRERDDAHGHARRLRVRHVRHVVARLPDVHRGDAQRHQPALRDVRQRRLRRHGGPHAVGRRDDAHVVPAESAAAVREVVAAEQQQLRDHGPAGLAEPHRQQPRVLPPQLLREEQAIDRQGAGRGPGRLRAACQRRPAGRAGGAACACCRSSASRFRAPPPRSACRCPSGGRRRLRRARRPWRPRSGRARRRRRRGAVRAAEATRRRRRPRQCPTTETREFPAGSYIIRMDQPYSRIADALLDYQYWAPNDPQSNPYDDTGWTFPEALRASRRCACSTRACSTCR